MQYKSSLTASGLILLQVITTASGMALPVGSASHIEARAADKENTLQARAPPTASDVPWGPYADKTTNSYPAGEQNSGEQYPDSSPQDIKSHRIQYEGPSRAGSFLGDISESDADDGLPPTGQPTDMFLADPEYFYGSRRTSSSGAPNGGLPNPADSGADGAVAPGAGSVSRTSPFAASAGVDPGVVAADVQAEGSGLPAPIADDYPPAGSAGTKDLAQQAVYDDLPSTVDAPDRSRYEDTFDPSSTPQVKSAYEPASTPIEYELGSTYYDPSTELDNGDLPPGTGGRGASSDAPNIPPTVTSLGPPPLPTTTGPSKKNPWYNSLTSCFRGRDQDGNAC